MSRVLVPCGVGVSCIGWQMGKSILIRRPSVTNQQINTIISDERVVDPLFLYYAMSMRRDELFRLASSGSRTPILNKSDFERLSLDLPPLPDQRAIAGILGSLDDTIDLNRRMNETLEAIARALFKSWFVDFDPVRARAVGRQPAGMDADTVALFPDGFEDSQLGEIPAGWTVKPLDKIATFLNGLALQKYPPQGDRFLPVIKIAQMHKGDTQGADRASADLDPAYVVDDGDVLFSWSGSLEVVIWCGGRGALNQHLFKVTSALYPKWFYYLWVRHHLPEFQAIAAGKATTMGHIQRHHLSQALVVVPPADLLSRMDRIVSPLLDLLVKSCQETRTLTSVRDALLPKLLSGEICIPAANRTMEASS
jgi:type I restriction enzyme, S subunit